MIVGINIESVNAKINREAKMDKRLSINNAPAITSVEKTDILDMKDVVLVKFTYKTTYEPDVAEIIITGDLLYKDVDAKKFLKRWEDKKEVDKKMAIEVLNTIFRKCLTMAIDLSM